MVHRSRAQVSTEFVVIIALVLAIVLSVVSVVSDIPGAVFSGERRRDNLAWYNAPIRVRYLTANMTQAVISLQNMMRDDVNVTAIFLDDVSYPISSLFLASGAYGQRNLTLTKRLTDVDLTIQFNATFYSGNYSLPGVPYHIKQT